ncbi:ankyrin repeat domain-containing protein 29 [Diplogelasinospora grovesii]|uniref:Ankyrin repeat domain-containing protein 29 n=1 Tax=Diplogelasinospora grovesii TaxID=303347 RepID=A0AAN6N5R6_9PEZI|nr:ankyrin repeat domain-containing protein 29 [Diplogelasinospora grovesii]
MAFDWLVGVREEGMRRVEGLICDNCVWTRTLIDGADLNLLLRCGWYETALIAAANCGGVSVEASALSALVERGADVDAVPARRELLVSRGADVNAVLDVGEYGSALAAAAWCDDNKFEKAEPVVLFLLEQGADTNAVLPLGTCGSALGAVLAMGKKGSPKMKRLLLGHGAELSGNEKPRRDE